MRLAAFTTLAGALMSGDSQTLFLFYYTSCLQSTPANLKPAYLHLAPWGTMKLRF